MALTAGPMVGAGDRVLRGKKEKAFFCPGPGAGGEETPGAGETCFVTLRRSLSLLDPLGTTFV